MDTYLNSAYDNDVIFREIIPNFITEKYNAEIFYRSSSADIYNFVTEYEVNKVVKLYSDNGKKITLDQIQEVSPGLVDLINILGSDYYDFMESTHFFIDEYIYDHELSASDKFLGEWKDLNTEQIIYYIMHKLKCQYELKNDIIFYNYDLI